MTRRQEHSGAKDREAEGNSAFSQSIDYRHGMSQLEGLPLCMVRSRYKLNV